jgi:hypothetical protein
MRQRSLIDACLALRRATDSRGRAVVLHTGDYTKAAFRESLTRLSEAHKEETDPEDIKASERNRKLLMDCMEAAR